MSKHKKPHLSFVSSFSLGQILKKTFSLLTQQHSSFITLGILCRPFKRLFFPFLSLCSQKGKNEIDSEKEGPPYSSNKTKSLDLYVTLLSASCPSKNLSFCEKRNRGKFIQILFSILQLLHRNEKEMSKCSDVFIVLWYFFMCRHKKKKKKKREIKLSSFCSHRSLPSKTLFASHFGSSMFLVRFSQHPRCCTRESNFLLGHETVSKTWWHNTRLLSKKFTISSLLLDLFLYFALECTMLPHSEPLNSVTDENKRVLDMLL